MKQHQRTYLHVLERNNLTDGTQVLQVEEIPPPYSICVQQSMENEWIDEIIELKPLSRHKDKYGFVISGGIDTSNGQAIVITHIEHSSKTLEDNGRSKLRLFDRILSINDTDLRRVTHDVAARAFSSLQGQCITLRVCRLNPAYIEHVELTIPLGSEDEPLGITIHGGLDEENDDCGLFITQIDSNGLLALNTKKNQVQVGDRLLEIKTNYTSANLQWVTHYTAAQLIRRICQDSRRITLIVAHRTSNL
ncbi:unnamed protein product [Adineta ricciae]|uniref:PDZ domain-containing protein n=1 Tax=Adineta ricciae TaxID=249248 RepID=A0A816GKE8_ADIRI|nr:unnamed protein product [Adineta ricciae]